MTQNSDENSGKSRGRAENLKPWPKGVSGNPGGRPRTAPLSEAIRDLLNHAKPGDRQRRSYAQCIAKKLVDLALAGDVSAARELANRAEGQALEQIEIASAGYITDGEFNGFTRAELKAFAETGDLPLWYSGPLRPRERIQ